MKILTAWISAIALAMPALAVSGLALAHESHAKKKAALVKKEQKEWGIAGDAKQVKRTIKLAMSDTMRFTPDKIEVRQGETVRISLKNSGKILHEMVIGTKKELEEHAAM